MLPFLLALFLQVPDTTCQRVARVSTDSLAKLHLASTTLTAYQVRNLRRLDSLHTARCVTSAPAPAPALPTYTLTVRQTDTVTTAPEWEAAIGSADSAGVRVSDSLGVTVADPAVLRVEWVPTLRRWRLHALATGRTALTWRWRRDSTITTIRTVGAVPPPDTTTPPPADTTPPPPPPPPPATGGFVGPAELPRAVPTWPAGLATAGCTVTVTANLQGALDAAKAGDVLCLSGAFAGSFTLPQRSDSGWVVVRSLLSPVAPGARVRPSQRAQLALIRATASNAAITAAPRARGWYLRELEVTTDSSLSTLTYSLIELPAGPTIADYPRDLVLDRVYAHGWAHRPLRRCVSLQSAATAIINSWLDDCHEKGADSQAIVSWVGVGPFLIENNHLAGAGENIMFGGGDPKFAGVRPSDITFRRNHVYTPPAWKGVWTKKNLLELKNAHRVLIEANVFDGSWGDAQTGTALLITSANQSGGCPWCGSADVTIRRNLIRRAAAPLVVAHHGDNPNVDTVTHRVAVIENFADSTVAYDYDGRHVQVYKPRDVLFQRNTWIGRWAEGSAYAAGNQTEGGAGARLTFDGDLSTRGAYGIMGCWTTTCAPGLSMRLALLGAPTQTLPGVSFFPSLDAALAAGFGVSRSTIDAATAGVVVRP